MKEQLYALLHLQKIDNEIAVEERRRRCLPERIRGKEGQIAKLENKYEQEKSGLKELQLKIKRREIDAKTVNDKIEKNKNELYGGKISDIKELKQLQKVIESLQEEQDKVEEELLVLMDEEDCLKLKIVELERETSELKEQLNEIKKQVEQEDGEIRQFIEQKEIERKEVVQQINDQSLVDRYNILWSDKNGEAIVEIETSTCSGCNLSLPSDIIYHLQKDDCLIFCPNCNRILVWKDIT